MEGWIIEELRKVDRRTIKLTSSKHLLYEKELQLWELPYLKRTIRFGNPSPQDSTEEEKRICFKLYFKDIGKTYFVVVALEENHFKIITRMDKHGKY